METEEGWREYRRMILDWHDEDVKSHARVDASLVQINQTLIELKTERRAWHWALGVVIPAVVSLLVASAARALGR